MSTLLSFVVKAALNACLVYGLTRASGYWRSGMAFASLLLFMLTLNLFPHGLIDIRSGNFIESGSLLFFFICYYLQAILQYQFDRKKLDLVIDLLIPLTLLSALVRYGSFDLAEIMSRQRNVNDWGIPLVGLVYDPINFLLFYWAVLVKFKQLRERIHMSGTTKNDLLYKLHLISLQILGLYIFLGGVPPTYEFNIHVVYNHAIQGVIAIIYILLYLKVIKFIMNKICDFYFIMNAQDIERSMWFRFIPVSLFTFILSATVFVLTGGRF